MEDVETLKNYQEKIGVIFLDINGLKDINDVYGHDKGDESIIQAAQYMKEVFPDAWIYRIGGDEFVILYLNIDEALFYEKINEMRRKMQPNGMLQMAIGATWSKDARELHMLIADADAAMYKDKREFYDHHHTSKRYRHYGS